MEIIRSRQNPLAKQLIKLAESRRERLKSRQTLLLGAHLLESAMAASWPIERLLICEGHQASTETEDLLARFTGPVLMLDRALFEAIELTPSSTGLMALCTIPETPSPVRQGFCLLLEGLQDPGNVGSILRTAAAAGVDQVWLSPGCADIWSPKVLRAGMGAHFRLPLLERLDIDAALDSFDGDLAITTLERAESLYQSDLRGNLVLALGNEGAGVSVELEERAHRRLHIPMRDAVESLNVAAAAAVCLFERHRQVLAGAN